MAKIEKLTKEMLIDAKQPRAIPVILVDGVNVDAADVIKAAADEWLMQKIKQSAGGSSKRKTTKRLDEQISKALSDLQIKNGRPGTPKEVVGVLQDAGTKVDIRTVQRRMTKP